MGALPRLVFACWLFVILAFCVYGLVVTSRIPGESFCSAMYLALTVFSGVCIFQILEPIRQRA